MTLKHHLTSVHRENLLALAWGKTREQRYEASKHLEGATLVVCDTPYTLQRHVGTGTEGSAFSATDEEGCEFALKLTHCTGVTPHAFAEENFKLQAELPFELPFVGVDHHENICVDGIVWLVTGLHVISLRKPKMVAMYR